MIILIIGSTGKLGGALKVFLKKYKKISILSPNRKRLNLLNYEKVQKYIQIYTPDVIINCAGSTDVNKCNKNYSYAYKGNVEICKNLSKIIKNRNIHLIHISTDQVYGKKKYPFKHLECDAKLSNNYSTTKYLGEKYILKHKKSTVLRTNFFGNINNKKLKTFSEFLISRLKKNKLVYLPDNIYFNPINIKKLIKIIKLIYVKKIFGLYNIGGDKIYNKFEFGCQIAKKYGFNKKLIRVYLSQKKNKRPLNTVMSIKKIKKQIKNYKIIV